MKKIILIVVLFFRLISLSPFENFWPRYSKLVRLFVESKTMLTSFDAQIITNTIKKLISGQNSYFIVQNAQQRELWYRFVTDNLAIDLVFKSKTKLNFSLSYQKLYNRSFNYSRIFANFNYFSRILMDILGSHFFVDGNSSFFKIWTKKQTNSGFKTNSSMNTGNFILCMGLVILTLFNRIIK